MTALICEDRSRTFAELCERISRAAQGFRRLGLHGGDRIGILAANSDRYLEALLAVAWADGVCNPLNARWSADEIAYAINDSVTRILLLGPTFRDLGPTLRAACPHLAHVVHLDDAPAGEIAWDQLIQQSDAVPDARRGFDEIAGIFYTGGTTGAPKGVMLTHTNIVSSALGSLATGDFLTAGGTLLTVAPLFHLAGIWPWVAQTALGGTTVVLSGFSPSGVVEAVQLHDVTETLLVPTMLQQVVTHLEATGQRLPSLRHLIYAGSPISETVLLRTRQVLPDVRLVQGYGMTETAPVATILGPDDHRAHLLRSAGRAAPHAEVRILDIEERECERGEIGEVVVYGPHVMKGYWNKAELTATTLRGGGMHTGDLGCMDDDGFVFVVDRLKDMIVSGGENVYTVEVENALATHAGVAACAVIGLPDAEWGERVHAVVVPTAGATLTLEELREHCRARIGRYKMPRSLDVVDELPLSAAGKILKHEIRGWYAHATEQACEGEHPR